MQVQQQELVGLGGGEIVGLDIHTAHPVNLTLESLHQVAADESNGTSDQSFFKAGLLWSFYSFKFQAPRLRLINVPIPKSRRRGCLSRRCQIIRAASSRGIRFRTSFAGLFKRLKRLT